MFDFKLGRNLTVLIYLIILSISIVFDLPQNLAGSLVRNVSVGLRSVLSGPSAVFHDVNVISATVEAEAGRDRCSVVQVWSDTKVGCHGITKRENIERKKNDRPS